MPCSFGYRARTRDMFSKTFRKHGMPSVRKYLDVIKIGDVVEIKADPAIQKGMPHKFYHGRSGKVWNVTRRGVGVIVPKVVKGRTLLKRICLRAEHVRKSRSVEMFKQRLAKNIELRKEGKEPMRFGPARPQPGKYVKKGRVIDL